MNFLDNINLVMVWITVNIIKPIFGSVVLFDLLSFLLFIALITLIVIISVKCYKRTKELSKERKNSIKLSGELKFAQMMNESNLSRINQQKAIIETREQELKEMKKAQTKVEEPSQPIKPSKKKNKK